MPRRSDVRVQRLSVRTQTSSATQLGDARRERDRRRGRPRRTASGRRGSSLETARGGPGTDRSRRRARARAPAVPPRAGACKILYTIMSHLTNRPACCRRRGRSISTARHADESSSSARATSAATHELDACALAIGQSHSAWMMPRTASAGRIARRARRVRRRDQRECRTRERVGTVHHAADGRRGPDPAA